MLAPAGREASVSFARADNRLFLASEVDDALDGDCHVDVDQLPGFSPRLTGVGLAISEAGRTRVRN